MAGIVDSVPPHRVVHAYGGCEVGGVTGDRSGRWRDLCKNSLLECVKAVRFRVFSPCTL